MKPYDKLFINMNMIDAQVSTISDKAIAIKEGKIAWCELENDLSSENIQKSKSLVDSQGQLLTPGLIDCHTYLGELSGLRFKTTFLGAPEYQKKRQVYVDYLCKEVMPLVKETGLADAIDVFCQTIAFSLKHTKQIFQAAQALKMPIKCHAESVQLMMSMACSFFVCLFLKYGPELLTRELGLWV